jgi:hypothetical protein
MAPPAGAKEYSLRDQGAAGFVGDYHEISHSTNNVPILEPAEHATHFRTRRSPRGQAKRQAILGNQSTGGDRYSEQQHRLENFARRGRLAAWTILRNMLLRKVLPDQLPQLIGYAQHA